MMEFSADKLKYMAAEVVSSYLHSNTPMSEAVASLASRMQLNPEQIKRLIEISNQVAYLKLLEKASDRTFEFPLANYEEVMALVAIPDESMKKEASQRPSPLQIASGSIDEDLVKSASEVDQDDELGFLKRASKQEKITLLNKQMYRAKGELEKVASEEQVLLRDLVSKGSDLREDDQFMDKLAMVLDGDEKTLTKIARLIYGEKRDYCSDELFYDSDVEEAREYVEMFKRAEEVLVERKELESQIKRAEEFLQKEAFAPMIGNAMKAITSVAKKTGDVAAKVAPKALDKAEALAFTSDQIAKPKRDVYKSIVG